MYKLVKNPVFNTVDVVSKEENGILYSTVFNPANTDYAEFKKAVMDGAELQDADGNVMTADEAKQFIGTLP